MYINTNDYKIEDNVLHFRNILHKCSLLVFLKTTHSCGNHGIGVAWAASIAGVKCCTVITNTASKVKVESVEAHGAEIVYCDPTPLNR